MRADKLFAELSHPPVIFVRDQRGAMDRVEEVSPEELERRLAAILDELGVTLDQFYAKATTCSLVGAEWQAWEEIQDLAFLLGHGQNGA